MAGNEKNKMFVNISEEVKRAIRTINISEYTLVVREEFCDKYLVQAKEQLKKAIQQLVGLEPIVELEPQNVKHVSQWKFICLGKTRRMEVAGIKVEEKTEPFIKMVDNSIFLYANDSQDLIKVVETFLSLALRKNLKSQRKNLGMISGTDEGNNFSFNGEQLLPSVREIVFERGIHKFSVKKTREFLVRNGRREYILVVPNIIGEFIERAVSELTFFFKQATGISLPIYRENDLPRERAKIISLGRTEALKAAKLVSDNKNSQAAFIKTKENNIYIFGGGEEGALYATYDFLQILFHYEVYSNDCINLDKNVKDVPLYEFDVCDFPDINKRNKSWGPVFYNQNNLKYRFRMPFCQDDYLIPIGDVEFGVKTKRIHNTFNVLPPDRWKKNNPEWYSDDGYQICYSAHGNREKYVAMIEQIVCVLKKNLQEFSPDKYPRHDTITFTMEDTRTWCTCKACQKLKKKYGADSGAVIVLLNKVAEKLKIWMSEPQNESIRRDNLKLVFFAYHALIQAPSHYDEKLKKYVVNHSDCKMREDVGVFYCLSDGIQYFVDINDPINRRGRENSYAWFDIAPFTYLWTYNTNFAAFMTMHNTFNFFTSNGYRFLAASNAEMLTNQASRRSYEFTAFQGLKAFLDYKLQWNVNLDSEELIEQWFNAMYKEASPLMKTLFREERIYNTGVFAGPGWLNDMSHIYSCDLYRKKDYWSSWLLLDWLKLCDSARETIVSIYGENNAECISICKRIDKEWMFPAFVFLKMFGKELEYREIIEKLNKQFKKKAKQLGAYEVCEHAGRYEHWQKYQDFVDSL